MRFSGFHFLSTVQIIKRCGFLVYPTNGRPNRTNQTLKCPRSPGTRGAARACAAERRTASSRRQASTALGLCVGVSRGSARAAVRVGRWSMCGALSDRMCAVTAAGCAFQGHHGPVQERYSLYTHTRVHYAHTHTQTHITQVFWLPKLSCRCLSSLDSSVFITHMHAHSCNLFLADVAHPCILPLLAEATPNVSEQTAAGRGAPEC